MLICTAIAVHIFLFVGIALNMLEIKKLSQCNNDETVTVTEINAEEIVKKRLELIGFCKGQKVTVLKQSAGTMLVVFGGKMLALGKSVCEGVSVD